MKNYLVTIQPEFGNAQYEITVSAFTIGEAYHNAVAQILSKQILFGNIICIVLIPE
jgi:hypothetical protein